LLPIFLARGRGFHVLDYRSAYVSFEQLVSMHVQCTIFTIRLK
jgi:hypothetical protein